MNTKSKNIILAAGALIAGYALGAIFGIPETSGNAGRGDISKVSKFHKAAVASQTSALEEKLKSDTLAFNEESATVELINSRMTDFADLVDFSIIAAADKDEFNEEVNSLINVRDLSENAVQVGKVASASLEYLSSGQKNELVTDYEQASQNLVVAFMMVDRQVQLGKQFVAAADKYLESKSIEEVPEVALVRDMWAQYCAESAYLNGDKQELAYWEGQNRLCNQDLLGKGAKKLVAKLDGQTLSNKLDGQTLSNKLDGQTLSNKLDGQTLSNKLDGQTLSNKLDGQTLSNKLGGQTLSNKLDGQTLSNKLDGKNLSNKNNSKELNH